MRESSRQSWLWTAVAVGFAYALIGLVFAVPTTHIKAWRLAAWVVCAIAYATHIEQEKFRLRNSGFSAALHVALAVGLGAFGLAVGANIHSMTSASSNEHRGFLLLALVLWPVMTSLPAFLVASDTSLVLTAATGSATNRK